MAIRTTRSHPLAIAGAALLALAACSKPNVARDAAPVDGGKASALSNVLSVDWESGIPAGWTAAASSGLCTWHVVENPQNLATSPELNPFSVTLPDSGAHLPAKGGTHVVWFGEDSTGTFIGSDYGPQSAKDGGSSAAVQAGTLTSPSISLAGATHAAVEFDSWWEIEGVAGQSYDMMIVQVSTNGSTWTEVGRLNPTFSTGAPSDSGYTAGGSSAPPEWRHYAFDVSSYAGQSIQVRFSFNTGDTAYNAFRGWTIDNLSVGAGDSLPAPTVTAISPAVGTAGDVVAISGTGFVQRATIWFGATQISTGNIMQLGTDYALVRVPSGLVNGTRYDVKVVNPDLQEGVLVQGFTYSSTVSPTVSSVSPATGSVGVAQGVTISGTNFVAGATVVVGPYEATGVTVGSATSITATFPAMPSGNYNVVVTNPSGQSGIRYAAYAIPVVVDSSTVTVTSPNGGESWGAGTTHAVTWTQTGVTIARIDLYKGGSFDQAIATDLDATSGSYSWTIPAGIAGGTDYSVKVSNQLGVNSDYGNASFTIGSAPTAVCGNGALEAGEACDDGNTAASDGCSATCQVEAGWSCPGGSSCAPVCGDGILAGPEGCDDGNSAPADGCSASCSVEPGYTCPSAGVPCASTCGDGVLTAGEQCDDGNGADGDGCSSACTIEAGSTCFFASPNLIQNGSFDDGATGWSSQYEWQSPSVSNAIYGEGTWSISGNANGLHDAIAWGFPDAEGSASNMAAYFNGASTPLDALTQTVNLTAGQQYVLSMYVTNWGGEADSPYPQLSISVGGQLLTTDLVLASSAWQRVGGTFTALATGPADLKVVDSITAAGGNDFAVDAVILREAASQVCGQTCAVDADCASAGAGYWCDTTAVGHTAFCAAPLPPGSPIPTIPNRDPSDPPLGGSCTPETAAAICGSDACNATQDTCATAAGACTTNSECISNVCNPETSACVAQYAVRFQTDGTVGASLSGSTSQTILSGGSASEVTAVPPVGYNFAGWTGTGSFVATSTNPLVVTGVAEDLTISAHFVTVGSITISSGGSMSAVVGTAFPSQLCVTVRDTGGSLLPGFPVTFGVPGSGATAVLGSPVTSDASGLACTSVTAGTVTGSFSVSAAGGSVTVATAATLTNLAGSPASLARAGSSVADQAATVGHAFTFPLAVVVRDSYGNLVPGAPVGFSSHADSGSGFQAILSSASAVTSAGGVAQVTATASTIAGWETIDVAVGAVPAATAFRLQGDPDAPATLTLDPGASPQGATVGGNAFANALGLTVTDQWGNAVSGASVGFTAPAGGATASLSATSATTDAAGHAQVTGATGNASGAYTVTVAVGGLSVPISLANTVGAPGAIVVVSGAGQATSVDGAFAAPLVVAVLDAYANPVPGVLVGFQLSPGTATATLSSAGQVTGSDGRASVTVTPGVVSGPLQVVAAADGVASPVTFNLLLAPGLPASVTAIPTSATQTARVATAFQNALAATVSDSHGNVIPGVQVTFTAPGSGAGAALSAASATTGEDGVASVAATANTVSGDYHVSAAVEGVDLPATFALANQPDAPYVLATSAGTAQSAVVHVAFAAALEVTVNDQYGNPVPGVTVFFTAPDAGATAELAAPSGTTGASGKVSSAATAGTVSGAYLVTASATDVAAPVQFSLVNLPGAPEALVVKSGASGQSTRVGEAYAAPLAASVLDHYGNAVPGVSVAFACPASEPTCTLDTGASTSDATGEVAVHATAGTRPGTYQVTAATDDVPTASFQLTNLVGPPGSIESTGGASQEAGVLTAFGAPLGVLVKDAFGNVVPGVEVAFEVVSTGAQGAVLSSASATTDGDGLASVTATANAAKGSYSVEASAPGVAVAAGFALTNVSIATVLTPHIDLPVFGTVVQESAITHVRVAVGPDAGESKATGTVTFRASRPIRVVAGQAGVSQAGDAVVATLADGAVDLQIEVVGWRSRTLEISYAPDEAAAQTWDPATTTVDLTAEVHDQTHGGGGGCSTGADGTVPLAVLPLLLLVLKSRRRRR